ncbi:MAG: 5'/3'-nucleotidase SurE [Deltaproteobacteria bacterium]|nr:5'/3'-nucleotidase SurE [Deltaproteobacteria bacterium]
MRILLTNDDGIHAPGLRALYLALSPDFHVDIVAPEVEMSAVGHAISLSRPLRVKKVRKNGRFYGYAVSGTPADCVKIALQELLDQPPDIILSGINLGANVGVDILYSGTVSAATEGAFMGIRSAAISLDTLENPDFDFAARFSKEIVRFLARHGLRDGTALNVNIPSSPPHEINGVRLTRQGMSRYVENYERRVDPRGNVYYWLSGEIPVDNGTPDTDGLALRERWISITPIHYDLTCEEELKRLKKVVFPTDF